MKGTLGSVFDKPVRMASVCPRRPRRVLNEMMRVDQGKGEWPCEAIESAASLLIQGETTAGYCIIDVGAHRGETFSQISKLLNQGFDYYAFEPNPDSFSVLSVIANGARSDVSVECLPSAVGATNGSVMFRVAKASEVSGILEPENELFQRVPSGDHELSRCIEVPQVSVDHFISQHGLGKIHLLKIDTEGYDLEVIKGAKKSLAKGNVEVIVCEVFFVKYRQRQSFFWDIATELADLKYSFVNLYDMRNTGQERLYTANAVWVSPTLAATLNYL